MIPQSSVGLGSMGNLHLIVGVLRELLAIGKLIRPLTGILALT